MNLDLSRFMRLIALGCVLIVGMQGQEMRVVGTVNASAIPRGRPVPQWNGSVLAFQDNSSVVNFVDTQETVTSIVLTIPDAVELHVTEAGHFSGEAFVVMGWAADRDKRIAKFMAFAYSDNRPTRITRMHPYTPMNLGIAQDGSIWTWGYEVTTPGHLSNTDAGMIRHFDASGNLLGSYLPQSSIDKKEDLPPGIVNFAVAANRAGWYHGPARYYFEVADGKLQKYPGIPESACEMSLTGTRGAVALALTDNGGVFANRYCGTILRVFSLNRTSGQWSLVDVPNDERRLSGVTATISCL